jgi:putative solute:sodium symporter small subunit
MLKRIASRPGTRKVQPQQSERQEDRDQMIEIGLGLVAIFSAVAIAAGLTDGLVPIPLGSGVIAAAALLGIALIGRGAYRLVRSRSGRSHELRSTGLALSMAGITFVIALALPALSEPLNLIKVAGFPLGLYAMGQGALIVFAVLLFVFAGWQSRVDDADEQ